jgi:uncharacterized membrane protein YagU involved in acid resistance
VKRFTPLHAVATGLAAGVVGTGAMTAWQELAARLRSAASDAAPESDQPPRDPWDDASAPAKVAKRIGEGVFHKPVSSERIPLLTNAMHWGYGTSWGAVYGLTAGSARDISALAAGTAFGTAVWLMSYAQLVPMGLYDPPWRTPSQELALDLSYHLVYGTGVANAFQLLTRRHRRR